MKTRWYIIKSHIRIRKVKNMKIKTFKVERWMNDYEDDAIYNLGETCIDSLTIKELLEAGG